ncbi:MAG: sodium/solute symporter [Mucinivorans sp.]
MKKILLLLCLLLCACASENRADPTTIAWEQEVPLPDSLGFSAMYGGHFGGELWALGGCNFPQKPAAEGGVKVFSDKIFCYDGQQWSLSQVCLPRAAAYGLSITMPKGIFMVGGTDGKLSLIDNHFFDGQRVVTLAPLPIGLDNFAGALMGGEIWVSGGLSNGVPNNRTFIYNVVQNEWREEVSLPGTARVQAVASAQNQAEEMRFYLMGGFDPATGKVLTDGYAFSPREQKWLPVASSPIALNGGVAVAAGVHSILFMGGVNEQRFCQGTAVRDSLERYAYMSHEPQWYNFNRKLIFYNTIVNRWADTGQTPFALAGALLATESGSSWWIVGGEKMPGVRSSEVWHGTLQTDKSFGWINWSVIGFYLLGMLGLGWFFMYRTKNSDHYFTGGGRIPWWAVSVSIFATMLSAITFMAIPAKTYATDWRYFLMAITIFFVAFPVVKYYLPFFRRLKITSAYEYLELRFNAATRVMASLLFIVFMTARMALVLYLPSLALTAATGIDIYLCILLMSLITIIYSSMGGIEAVIWGDVVQGIILMGGAIFTLVYLVMHTDGNALQIALDNDKFQIFDWTFDLTKATIWVVLIGGAANQLISYSSDQTIIQRYMTTASEKKAAKSIITNGVLSVISSLLFYAIGTALFAYFYSRPATLDFAMPTGDSIFPFYIMNQLPVGIAGVMIAAIFAASMSTVSSNINSISTAFTVDIFSKLRPMATERARMLSARLSSVVCGVLGTGFALMMATWNVLSLFDWFNTILGLLTSGLGALFFMGIFFDRIKGRAAIVGFVLGTVAVIVMSRYTNVSFLLYGLIGMLITIAISFVLSYILPEQGSNLDGLTWKKLKR